jgi:hypothetical protein
MQNYKAIELHDSEYRKKNILFHVKNWNQGRLFTSSGMSLRPCIVLVNSQQPIKSDSEAWWPLAIHFSSRMEAASKGFMF